MAENIQSLPVGVAGPWQFQCKYIATTYVSIIHHYTMYPCTAENGFVVPSTAKVFLLDCSYYRDRNNPTPPDPYSVMGPNYFFGTQSNNIAISFLSDDGTSYVFRVYQSNSGDDAAYWEAGGPDRIDNGNGTVTIYATNGFNRSPETLGSSSTYYYHWYNAVAYI